MDRSYLILAAKYVRRQVKQLLEQVQGMGHGEGANDIEFVHCARVASRRLRAALKMFAPCFGQKKTKRWAKQMRRVTRKLGAARDRDVQATYLCDALSRETGAGICRGVGRLLSRCEHQRDALQPSVVKAVKRLEQSGVLDQMQAVTHRILRKIDADSVALGSAFALAETTRHIRGQLNDLLSYQDCLQDADDEQRHHAMRIAAKRLRYTLEIASPVYEKRLAEVIDAVKRIQTLLGDIHDCDVWQDEISEFAVEERQRIAECYGTERPFVQLEAGIGWMREDRRTQRRRAFAELVDYWAELQRHHIWDRLAELLEECEETCQRNGRGKKTLPAPGAGANGGPPTGRVEAIEETPRPHRLPPLPVREKISSR